MTKHIADHRSAPDSSRVLHFLRIAHYQPEAAWRATWRKPVTRAEGNRRLVEFVRIERTNQI